MFIWINHSTWGSCQVIVLFNYTILGTWCLRWVTPGTAPLHWKSPVILQYPYEYKQLCLDISLVPNQISQTPLFCLWKSTTKLFLLSSKSVNNNRSEQICPPPPLAAPSFQGRTKVSVLTPLPIVLPVELILLNTTGEFCIKVLYKSVCIIVNLVTCFCEIARINRKPMLLNIGFFLSLSLSLRMDL